MFSFFKKKPEPKPAPFVLPRIKHTNFLAALEQIPGMTEATRPVIEPLVGDLVLTYAIDVGPAYVSVTHDALPGHGLVTSDLRPLAEQNARNALRDLDVRTDDTLFEFTAPENMAACSILFPALWDHIERELGGPVLVAFPHRDLVLYTRADSPKGIAALSDAVGSFDFEDTHALSRLPYGRRDGAWRVMTS